MSLPDRLARDYTDLLRPADQTFRYRQPSLRAAGGMWSRWLGTRRRGSALYPESRFLTPQWRRLLEYLVNCGFAEHIALSLPYTTEPALYHFRLAIPSLTHMHTDGAPPRVPGLARGCGRDYARALSACFGECLERVPFLLYRNADFFMGSASELALRGMPHVNPDTLDAFSAEQRDAHPEIGSVRSTAPYRWKRVRKLGIRPEDREEDVWLPAQLFHWTYQRLPSEPQLAPVNTLGEAGFFTKEGALIRSLYQWIQWDGVFSHWHRGTAPRRIDPASAPESGVRELIDKAELFGFTVHILDVTPEGVPVPSVCCILTSESDPVARIAGGVGAHVDLLNAMQSAVEEALSMHHWHRASTRECVLPNARNAHSMFTEDGGQFDWWKNLSLEHVSFLVSGPEESFDQAVQRYPDQHEKTEQEVLRHIASILRAAGREIYYAEARHPVLAELGYVSVKTFVTGHRIMRHDTYAPLLQFLEKRFAPCHDGVHSMLSRRLS